MFQNKVVISQTKCCDMRIKSEFYKETSVMVSTVETIISSTENPLTDHLMRENEMK